MIASLQRQMDRLEKRAVPPGPDLAGAIEAGRRRAQTMTPEEMRQHQAARRDEMRGRAAELNRLERAHLAGLERVLAS